MKKFLTFLALACFMVAGAWAQAYQLGSKVTDLASLSAEKLYAIHSTNNEGYWCYNSTINQNYVGITGVKTDGSGVVGNAAANTAYHAAFQPGNVNNQWKITNEDGAYYLYNVGAGQYVTRTDRDYLFTTEKTALDAIHANANGSFAIHAGGGYSGGSTNFACIVTNSTPQAVRNWTSTDHGSMLEFFEIEEISQLQDDLNALIATVEEAYAANDEAIWGANLITANSQFSSNATESSEGNINNLLDGNLSSYWHSQWSAGDKPMHTHYLQVTLTEAIEGSIQMTMGRRQGANNDHPMEMSVEYSTDNSTYTLLEGQSMEFSGTTGYVYGTFTLPTAAKYLRFYVDRTDKMRGYWHCSEFQLKSLFKQAANDQHPTEAAALQNALATAKAVTSATQTDIDNLQAALNTYKAAVDPVKTTITWNLYDGTTLVDSETKADCEKDREYTTTLTVPYGCLIEGTKTVTATNENQTITLNRVADPAFPFQYADSKENIQHWYALNIHHNNKHYVYYSADATPNVQANVTTYEKADEYAWGFVGNPTDGFVIYNKASDTALYSADNNTSCTVGATASTFKATLTGWTAAQADGGFCLNVEGQQYVNFQGEQLKHWSDNDAGSTFHAVEIDLSIKDFTFSFSGNPSEAKATYDGHDYTDGQGFSAISVDLSAITATKITGYLYTITLEGTNINVTYTKLPFTVDKVYTIMAKFADTGGTFYVVNGESNAVGQAELPTDGTGEWLYTEDGFFQNVATNKYLAANAGQKGLSVADNGHLFTYEAGIAEGTYKIYDSDFSYAVNKSGAIDGGRYGTHAYVNTGDWTTDFVISEVKAEDSYTLTISEYGVSTICLPENAIVPEGVTVYISDGINERGNLNMVELDDDVMPAYAGYVVEGDAGDYVFNYTDQDYTGNFSDEFYTLIGETEDTPVSDYEGWGTPYVLSVVDGQLGFYKYAGEIFKANRAFYLNTDPAINGFSLDFGGQIVGVNSVISAANLKAGYDIQGRKLNKIQKGINILNGKKIIK